MTKTQRIIHAALCFALLAVMVAPILFAPVMSAKPDRTISATAYFGDSQ